MDARWSVLELKSEKYKITKYQNTYFRGVPKGIQTGKVVSPDAVRECTQKTMCSTRQVW